MTAVALMQAGYLTLPLDYNELRISRLALYAAVAFAMQSA
jgi:hypothetical protein